MLEAAPGIDHLVLSVRDLEAARQFFSRAGFTLTPRAEHPFGTANHLAIMDGNFLELLATVAPEKIPPHAPGRFSLPAQHRSLLARRQGLSFVVLSSEDARADRARFLAAGLPASAPLDFSRLAGQPDGSQATMSFSLVIVADPALGDAPHFVCQQHTPEYFWHPQYQRHANAAGRIGEVVLVAAAPGELAPYYAALVAPNAVHGAGRSLLVETARGRIVVLPPDGLGERFAGIEVPPCAPLPYIAGLQIVTGDLGKAASALQAAGIRHAARADSLRVAPADAFGAAIEFVAG
jgi:catechol 2,3-dioxygenase-like lactoylglutathione lyase family enzyme